MNQTRDPLIQHPQRKLLKRKNHSNKFSLTILILVCSLTKPVVRKTLANHTPAILNNVTINKNVIRLFKVVLN